MLDTDGRDTKFPVAFVDIINGMPRNYSIDVTHIARAWISEPEANRGLLLWLRQDRLVPRCQSLVSIASGRDTISDARAPSITLHFLGKLPWVEKNKDSEVDQNDTSRTCNVVYVFKVK